MPLAAELELPSFDHTDATLRGERYRRAMADLHGLEKLPLKLEREE